MYTTILVSTEGLLAEFKLLASLGLLSTLKDVIQHGAQDIRRPVLQAIRLSLSNDSKYSNVTQDAFEFS